MNAHRLFLPVYVVLAVMLLMYSCGVRAEGIRTGETHTGMVAICKTADDAATLIGLTTKYGQKTGISWMQEEDNTCTLTPVTFKVGEVELDGIKDRTGTSWMILGVTANEEPFFIVVPSSIYVHPASL